MARKNNVKSDHPGSIHFDSRTRTVMAGQDSHDNIKEKVQAVREVVPGKSNNEIVLVLQYYDYNVEKAIQAYFEDGAKEALGEWHVPAVKPNKKKKNKKKPSSPAEADTGASTPTSAAGASSTASSSAAAPSSSQSVQKAPAASNGISTSSSSSSNGSNNKSSSLPNGDLHFDSESRLGVPDPSLLGAAASGNSLPPVPSAAGVSSKTETVNGLHSTAPSRTQNHPRIHSGSHGHGHGHSHGHGSHGHAQRARTASERSTASSVGAGGDNHSKRPFQGTSVKRPYQGTSAKRPFQGLEKSIKDLQRQTTSLERLRLVLDHETDRSYKSIKTVFEEMRTHLNTREKQLLAEMDVVKQQAYDVFKMRQEKAAMLKVQIERAEKLSESELTELRADVKHFVADRKVDEELGRTTRFHYDSDHLKEEILTFGEVLPVKCAYSVRRPSVSSVASSGVGNEDTPVPSQDSPVTTQPAPIQDGYQMTTEEVANLQMRLKNSLKIQGFSQGSPAASSSGTAHSASQEDDTRKTKSAKRRNRNRERQEQRKNEEEGVSSSPVHSSVSSTDARPSLHQQAASQSVPDAGDLHSSPLPQRTQPHSPSGRGRGRGGRRGSGSMGYRGQGQNRGSPRRPYSGSGTSGGGGGGGGRGGGEPDRRQGSRPVLVNGNVN